MIEWEEVISEIGCFVYNEDNDFVVKPKTLDRLCDQNYLCS